MSDTLTHQDDSAANREYVTFVIADQIFGIPVLAVQDVLNPRQITRIPLAPPEIAGSLNLRGRIVTAIDVRCRLNLESRSALKSMSVVVEHGGELYSLLVDSVGEVLALDKAAFEPNPPTLDPIFKEFSLGICSLADRLLVVLNVNKLLDYDQQMVA